MDVVWIELCYGGYSFTKNIWRYAQVSAKYGGGAACPLGAGRRSSGGLISAVFQACLDREIQSGSIGTSLAARYHFPKHFEQIPFPGSRCFSPLQPRVFLRSVPKSQYFHDLRRLNNSK